MSAVGATRRLELPELVHRAESLAIAMRFELSSSPEIGRLLAVLISQRARGRFAEIGSGCGVGSAWIASAMGPEATFVTVEADEERAGAVSRLFADHAQVRALHGDWHDLLPAEAPFDLLFFDGGSWKHGDVEAESEAALELADRQQRVWELQLVPRGRVVDPAPAEHRRYDLDFRELFERAAEEVAV